MVKSPRIEITGIAIVPFVFVEESTSSSDLSTLTTDLQLNTDEKSEDWLQVGKRNRTHVLRTVSERNLPLPFHAIPPLE